MKKVNFLDIILSTVYYLLDGREYNVEVSFIVVMCSLFYAATSYKKRILRDLRPRPVWRLLLNLIYKFVAGGYASWTFHENVARDSTPKKWISWEAQMSSKLKVS